MSIFYTEEDYGNAIQSWLENIPIHFICVNTNEETITELSVVTKTKITNCHKMSQITIRNDFKQQLQNYILSHHPEQYAIITFGVPFDGIQQENSPSAQLKNLLLNTFQENYGKVCCIDYITLFEVVFRIYNVPFDKESVMNEKTSLKPIKQFERCEYHQNVHQQNVQNVKREECSLVKAMNMADTIQFTLFKNDIPVVHSEELVKMKQAFMFEGKRSYLFIERVVVEKETIEIGFLIFEYHPGKTKEEFGKFVFKEQNSYLCQPLEIKKGLEYFGDHQTYTLDICLQSFLGLIVKLNVDYVLFASKNERKWFNDSFTQYNIKMEEQFSYYYIHDLKTALFNKRYADCKILFHKFEKELHFELSKQLNFTPCDYHENQIYEDTKKHPENCINYKIEMTKLELEYLNEKKFVPQKRFTPFDSNYLYINAVMNNNKLIEIGYALINHTSNDLEDEEYTLVDECVDVIHCEEMPDNDQNELVLLQKYSREQCIQQIMDKVINNEEIQFDFIIYGSKETTDLFNQFDKTLKKRKICKNVFDLSLTLFMERNSNISIAEFKTSAIKNISKYIQQQIQFDNNENCVYHSYVPMKNQCFNYHYKFLLEQLNFINSTEYNPKFFENTMKLQNVTFLYIESVLSFEEIVEIGYSLITHKENNPNGYEIVSQKDLDTSGTLYCIVKKQQNKVDRTIERYNEKDCIEHIVQNVIRNKDFKFDYIVFSSNKTRDLFTNYDNTIATQYNFYMKDKFIKQLFEEHNPDQKDKFETANKLITEFVSKTLKSKPCIFHKKLNCPELCFNCTNDSFIQRINYINKHQYDESLLKFRIERLSEPKLTPFNHTFLYIDYTTDKNSNGQTYISEIGWTFFEQNEMRNEGMYHIIQEGEMSLTKGMGKLTEAIKKLNENVIRANRYDYIIFVGKKLISEFEQCVKLPKGKYFVFDTLLAKIVTSKMNQRVKSVFTQYSDVSKKEQVSSQVSCSYHSRREFTKPFCVLNKLEKQVNILNYFLLHCNEIHQENPFKFEERMTTTTSTSTEENK